MRCAIVLLSMWIGCSLRPAVPVVDVKAEATVAAVAIEADAPVAVEVGQGDASGWIQVGSVMVTGGPVAAIMCGLVLIWRERVGRADRKALGMLIRDHDANSDSQRRHIIKTHAMAIGIEKHLRRRVSQNRRPS